MMFESMDARGFYLPLADKKDNLQFKKKNATLQWSSAKTLQDKMLEANLLTSLGA
jgi:hypothetical protein